MKNQRFLLIVLSLTALVSTASGARFYVQPSIALAKVDRFEAEFGGSLALGVLFAQRHAVEIECSRFSFNDTISEGGFTDELDFEITPILLNYRYEFPLTQKFFAYGGASVGVTLQEFEGRYSYTYTQSLAGTTNGRIGFSGTTSGKFGGDDQAFSVGANAGVGYRFSDKVALVLSAKWLFTAETDVSKKDSFPIIRLGVNFLY